MSFQIPKIGFGVYAIPRDQTAKCVCQALETGYRLVDSAALYGNEREAMQGVRDFVKKHPNVPRSEIIYVSKVWDDSFGYDSTLAAVEDSVEKAGEPIDLYLLHSSGNGPQERKESWKALEAKVQEGKLKHIGVSNWGIHHLKELEKYAKVKPVVNEIEVNPWKRMDELVSYCQNNGIRVLCYSPLILGKKMSDPELVELSKKYNKSPGQILLRYLVQRDITPLPKTVSQERMAQNLDVFDWELSAQDFKDLGDPKAYVMALPGWDPTKWS